MSNYRYPFQANYPYHIYNRGFDKQQIFFSDKDYMRFLTGMQFLLTEFPHIHLHAFCLLPNHFHLIATIETGLETPEDRSLSRFMHRLQLSYTMYAKTKYRDDIPRGPFFEGRFNAKILEDEQYLSSCMSYVCYNAIKHELVKDIRDWPWTSYHQIVDGVILPHLPTVISTSLLLDYVDIDEE